MTKLVNINAKAKILPKIFDLAVDEMFEDIDELSM